MYGGVCKMENSKVKCEDLWCWCYLKTINGIYDLEGGSTYNGNLSELAIIFIDKKNFFKQLCNN